jgi:predicted O-methyltransferase YrrM
MRKSGLIASPQSVSIEQLKNAGVLVYDNPQRMCEEFFDANFEIYADESNTWFSQWIRWQREVSLEAPKLWNAGENLLKCLFMITRFLKPSTIVETGTANGASAAAISAALQLNGKGMLHTFDVYDFELSLVPEDSKKTIQKYLVSNLISMQTSLSRILKNNEGISIFFHDSNHSYEHQSWEYAIARLLKFDILVSDDVDDSQAFLEFSSKTKLACIDGEKIIGVAKLEEKLYKSV